MDAGPPPPITSLTGAGVLYLEPTASGWYVDLRGPFLFQGVTGGFVATMCVRLRGTGSGLPSVTWSLTQGRATHARTFHAYEEVPAHEVPKVVEAAKKEREELAAAR